MHSEMDSLININSCLRFDSSEFQSLRVYPKSESMVLELHTHTSPYSSWIYMLSWNFDKYKFCNIYNFDKIYLQKN